MRIIDLIRKKRVGDGGVCPHSRQGGTLVIDCSDCEGACDLGSMDCLNSIAGLLAREGEVESIHLHGEIDVRYGERATAHLNDLAEVVRICRSHRREAPSRECADCPCRPEAVFDPIAASIVTAPFHRVRERLLSAPRDREECEECRRISLASLGDVEAQIAALTERVNQAAFHVVEVSGDA